MNGIYKGTAKKNDEKFSYEVLQKCGQLSEGNGWSKELRLISWNGGEPQYDIRSWHVDTKGNEKMSQRCGLTGEELVNLYQLIGLMIEDEEGNEDA